MALKDFVYVTLPVVPSDVSAGYPLASDAPVTQALLF